VNQTANVGRAYCFTSWPFYLLFHQMMHKLWTNYTFHQLLMQSFRCHGAVL